MLSSQPVVFGEVLFDSFPDGRRVLGGAPFNVAWHLQGFGLRPRFVSRIGRDVPGEAVLDAMRGWSMDTAEVQIDPVHPTGRVEVTIHGGEPSFDIGADQAYDFVDPEGMARPGASCSVLYHGSLGIRSDLSRQALERLGAPTLGVVCDLNLRKPWWTRDRVEWCMRRADWLKLNAGELGELTRMPSEDPGACLSAAEDLVRTFDIPNLVVTRGKDGALGLFRNEPPLWQEAAEVTRIVDTVGAGDGFSAVLILGVLKDWRPEAILERAVAFAARICRQRGATAADASVYAPLVETARD